MNDLRHGRDRQGYVGRDAPTGWCLDPFENHQEAARDRRLSSVAGSDNHRRICFGNIPGQSDNPLFRIIRIDSKGAVIERTEVLDDRVSAPVTAPIAFGNGLGSRDEKLHRRRKQHRFHRCQIMDIFGVDQLPI
jgi:hypothetical protein